MPTTDAQIVFEKGRSDPVDLDPPLSSSARRCLALVELRILLPWCCLNHEVSNKMPCGNLDLADSFLGSQAPSTSVLWL